MLRINASRYITFMTNKKLSLLLRYWADESFVTKAMGRIAAIFAVAKSIAAKLPKPATMFVLDGVLKEETVIDVNWQF